MNASTRLLTATLIVVTACSTTTPSTQPIVAVNPDPTAGFEPGAPEEMRRLISWMGGEWTVDIEFRDLFSAEDRWTRTATRRVTYTSVYGDAFLVAEHLVAWPDDAGEWRWTLLLSWDRFQERFRAAVWDDQWALLDVYDAVLEADELRGTNRDTGTYGPGGPDGEMVPGHFSILREPDGFTFRWMGPDRTGELVPLIRLIHRRGDRGRDRR